MNWKSKSQTNVIQWKNLLSDHISTENLRISIYNKIEESFFCFYLVSFIFCKLDNSFIQSLFSPTLPPWDPTSHKTEKFLGKLTKIVIIIIVINFFITIVNINLVCIYVFLFSPFLLYLTQTTYTHVFPANQHVPAPLCFCLCLFLCLLLLHLLSQ